MSSSRSEQPGQPAMLSLHEIAALMVISRNPSLPRRDCADLQCLSREGLVDLEKVDGGRTKARVSESGHRFLSQLSHLWDDDRF